MYSAIFGESPATQQAAEQRNSAFQSWLNTRKQAAEQKRTDDVTMAKYNALGNALTTMVQPLGWGIGGGFRGGNTGGVQPYDQRQYLEAFNRAVKAADDIRNIGTAEGEYEFKLADENYRRQLALEDEARKRQYAQQDLEQKANQRIAEINQKFENDMAKINRQGEIRQQIAEFNATHKITSRSTGLSIDERMKLQLMKQYGQHVHDRESFNQAPLPYEEWLKGMGYSTSTGTQPAATRPAGNNGAGNNTRKDTNPTKKITVPAAPASNTGGPAFKLQ